MHLDEIGIAGRTIDNPRVQNMQVEVPSNWYGGMYEDHSNMDSSEVWENVNNELE